MYKPKKICIEGHKNPYEWKVIDECNDELVKHCQLIGELQAINTDLLNRIRMLEEKLMH